MTKDEVMKQIIEMTDDDFEAFAESITTDQAEIMRRMRFFHRLFNDSIFYKAVEQSVAEAAYNTLRGGSDYVALVLEEAKG